MPGHTNQHFQNQYSKLLNLRISCRATLTIPDPGGFRSMFPTRGKLRTTSIKNDLRLRLIVHGTSSIEKSCFSVEVSKSEHHNFIHKSSEIDRSVQLHLSHEVIFDLSFVSYKIDAFLCRKVALIRYKFWNRNAITSLICGFSLFLFSQLNTSDYF